jgi:hypothetical protein
MPRLVNPPKAPPNLPPLAYTIAEFACVTRQSRASDERPGGFVFSLAKWVRFLIVPGADHALLYADLEQAEFGIAAALSDDPP